jgi:hypothetical protein
MSKAPDKSKRLRRANPRPAVTLDVMGNDIVPEPRSAEDQEQTNSAKKNSPAADRVNRGK